MATEQSVELDAKREARTTATLEVELAVTGMTCANCARHVTEAIQRVPGVSSASVHLQANQALVRWRAGAAQDVSAVVRAVEEAGYGATVAKTAARRPGRSTVRGWQLNLWVGVWAPRP